MNISISTKYDNNIVYMGFIEILCSRWCNFLSLYII